MFVVVLIPFARKKSFRISWQLSQPLSCPSAHILWPPLSSPVDAPKILAGNLRLKFQVGKSRYSKDDFIDPNVPSLFSRESEGL